MKTRKCLEIRTAEYSFDCIETTDQHNPFRLYHLTTTWTPSEGLKHHRKLIARYANFESIICRLHDIIVNEGGIQ